MPALSNFLKDEIDRRGWAMEEFAKRAQLSLSNAYLIVRDGKDNVRRATFENIAAALLMSPADLMVTIGKGSRDDDPKRAPIHATIRQVPDENLGLLDRLVRTLVPQSRAKTSLNGSAKTLQRNRSTDLDRADPAVERSLGEWYGRPRAVVALAGAQS